MPRLFIVEATQGISAKGGRGGGYLFFCPNYIRLLDWERRLGTLTSRIVTGPLISQAADQLRQPFLNLITAQGKVHGSIAWWASRLSERNTMVSPLFLNCCYLQIGQTVLESKKGSLCVIAESWAVLESLASTALRYGWSVEWVARKSRIAQRVHSRIVTVARVATFFGRALLQICRDRPASPHRQPHILLRTWVDEACFSRDGLFRDRYLPGLCKWLETQGYAVTTIPVLFNLRRSYRSAWNWLRNSNQKFLNPYAYYRPSDYWFTLLQARQQISMPAGTAFLVNLDCTRLFDEARRFHAWDVGSLQAILSYRLPRRLAEKGLLVDLYIDSFENMIVEKPLILGFRRFFPETRLVGFQHGALPPNILCLFVTKGESGFAPLPDRIVCNGPFFRDVLIREGLPEGLTVAGPALRYRHLWRQAPCSEVPAKSGIFVPLPMMLSDAAELLMKLIQAFAAEPKIRLFLKPHPMSSARMLGSAGISSLPQNFEIVSGDISSWLVRAQVVIALSSSALYEALAAGVPVLPVGREAALDLNPLAWHANCARQYYSASEIRDEALRLLQISPDELRSYQEQTQRILEEGFGQVNDSTLSCFVDGLLPARNYTPGR